MRFIQSGESINELANSQVTNPKYQKHKTQIYTNTVVLQKVYRRITLKKKSM